jgi:hypothetical protein
MLNQTSKVYVDKMLKTESENDLIEIFAQMAIAGINTVFLATLNSS